MSSKVLVVVVVALWLLPMAGCNCRPLDTHLDSDEPEEIDLDGDGHASYEDGGDDCDDDNRFVHPEAFEVCDGADNDCDDFVDEDALDAMTWYDDDDDDGFGDPDDTARSCGPPAGFVADSTDCDDTDASIYPNADEIPADGTDQDCDGDESCYIDADLDGAGGNQLIPSADLDCEDLGEASAEDDCDDTDPTTYPGAAPLDSLSECMSDRDGDGYGDEAPAKGIESGTDCDDSDPAAYPGADEIVADGLDQDCDTDELCWEDGDLDGFGDPTGPPTSSADTDCDDVGESWNQDDCDDDDDDAYPGGYETPGDGVDGDCDSQEECYVDDDSDGFGTVWTRISTDLDCADTREATVSGDCDDTDATVYPDADEHPADGVDSDCDGAEDCYTDEDGDGFGTDEVVSSDDLLCVGVVEAWTTGDCDDEDAATYPEADEVVGDGTDQDCDGYEDCYGDGDLDGYGSGDPVTVEDLDCDDEGESSTDDDCADDDPEVHPEAEEQTADGVDQDCDTLEVCYLDGDEDGFGIDDPVLSPDLDCSADGEADNADDCLDTDDSVYPDADEIVADGIDQDCHLGDACYLDEDGDGHGSGVTVDSEDLDCEDEDESPTGDDCDDLDELAYPDGDEVWADGRDGDCDGVELCFADRDGDGWGDPDAAVDSVDLDCSGAGEADDGEDCDDGDDGIHPDADEVVADGIDQDCDEVDRCYRDKDDDGFGVAASRNSDDLDCDDPFEADNADDCADRDATVYPGADEIPLDGTDQDCDGGDVCYEDRDLDGFGTLALARSEDLDCDDPGESTTTDDCDDADHRVHPEAFDLPADGIDQDCDEVDSCFDDRDDDGFGVMIVVDSDDLDCEDPYESANADDCDDTSELVYPGADEIPLDGTDQDCDGGDDCYEDRDLDGVGTSARTKSEDLDCDDPGESATTDDCRDTDARVYPGADEIVADGIDQDCHLGDRCYEDGDTDGHGSTVTIDSDDLDCDDEGESAVSDDCNDENKLVYPGTVELPADGQDTDCIPGELCFADTDGDGFGSLATLESEDLACDAEGESAVSTDCDDEDDLAYPGADEIPADAVDQDCDGGDDCYDDGDGDGFGGPTTVSSLDMDCLDEGESTNAEDCAPADGDIYPGADEIVADGTDQDCFAGDLCYLDDDGDHFGTTVTVVSADLACDAEGESAVSTDCDDEDELAYPGADEIPADAVDQDCDGGDVCYDDGDDDGFGGPTTVSSLDMDCLDEGESTTAEDCAPADGDIYPGADEIVADGTDQDCDDGDLCYLDGDGDDFGTMATVVGADLACDAEGESAVATDCDDEDDLAYPGADEIPVDGIDQDCDGGDVCYVDGDGDGHGTSETTPSEDLDCNDDGEAATSDDCAPEDPAAYPGAEEIPADGTDQDCEDGDACYADGDGDHFGTSEVIASQDLDCTDEGEAAVDGDCDDEATGVYPGAVEVVDDGADQDCFMGDACYEDGDLDGFGIDSVIPSDDLDCTDDGESTVATDCDDDDDDVYPGASEIVADGEDQDCSDGDACYEDGDGDGFGSDTVIDGIDLECTDEGEADNAEDCDDVEEHVYPGAVEVCDDDDVDEDCDGWADDDDPDATGLGTWYLDYDGDGFGVEGFTVESCDAVSGYVDASTDCDDRDDSVYPSAPELCDGILNDCDGEMLAEEADGDGDFFVECALDAGGWDGAAEIIGGDDCLDDDVDTFPGAAWEESLELCMTDADEDGWGAEEPEEGVEAGTDCDDTAPSVYPYAAEEVADGIDQDCDDGDTCYADVDGDGFGSAVLLESLDLDCTDDGESTVSTDCDDTEGFTYPGIAWLDSTEACMRDFDGDHYGDETEGGAYTPGDDCDDTEATTYPTADETVADGIDQDCDDGDACFEDGDGDGFGTSTVVGSADLDCEDDGEATASEDCEDDDDGIYPGADDVLNGLDDDCDDLLDYMDDFLMAGVTPGTFLMGSPESEVGRDGSDEELHQVTLTKEYRIGVTEVTQDQFTWFMGYEPSTFTDCGECPVETLTWSEAAAFANEVSDAAGLEPCYTCTGSGAETDCTVVGNPHLCEGFRLPTEAEWEMAARGSTTTAFSNGGSLDSDYTQECHETLLLTNGEYLEDIDWHCGTSSQTQPVAQLEPNPLGLYDVHGNVWEMCSDWHAPYDGDETNPTGPSEGTKRTLRSGSWGSYPHRTRSAERLGWDPADAKSNKGFRLARGTAIDDDDGDGYGDADSGGTDCDDLDADVYPGAEEVDNGIDDDCDGLADYLFVELPAGFFNMGSPTYEVGRNTDESQHRVTLTHPFHLGTTEVTQGQFQDVMGFATSYHSGCDDCPVEHVTWSEATALANAISDATGLEACYSCTGEGEAVECEAIADPYECRGYRLPTEAEWEYAARAGYPSAFPTGGNLVSGDESSCTSPVVLDDGSVLDDIGWFCANSASTTNEVAWLDPNERGLHDVVGNVWEWCHDWYAAYGGTETDPTGPTTGTERVRRGGAYSTSPKWSRVAARESDAPDTEFEKVGLRLARTMPTSDASCGADLVEDWSGMQGYAGVTYLKYDSGSFSEMSFVPDENRWESSHWNHIKRSDGSNGYEEVFSGHPESGSSGISPAIAWWTPVDRSSVSMNMRIRVPIHSSEPSTASISLAYFNGSTSRGNTGAVPTTYTEYTHDFGPVSAGTSVYVLFGSRGDTAYDSFMIQELAFSCE